MLLVDLLDTQAAWTLAVFDLNDRDEVEAETSRLAAFFVDEKHAMIAALVKNSLAGAHFEDRLFLPK